VPGQSQALRVDRRRKNMIVDMIATRSRCSLRLFTPPQRDQGRLWCPAGGIHVASKATARLQSCHRWNSSGDDQAKARRAQAEQMDPIAPRQANQCQAQLWRRRLTDVGLPSPSASGCQIPSCAAYVIDTCHRDRRGRASRERKGKQDPVDHDNMCRYCRACPAPSRSGRQSGEPQPPPRRSFCEWSGNGRYGDLEPAPTVLCVYTDAAVARQNDGRPTATRQYLPAR